METYVALLRGINVGGHNRIRMADLKTVLTGAGITDPVTLLQSGNVVFDSNADPVAVVDIIETTIETAFGFHSDVILRSRDEFRGVVDGHPFPADQLKNPRMAHVMFFGSPPDPDGYHDLRMAHEGPEELTLIDRELFVYYTEGSGRSKLNGKAIEKHLGVPGTARNWNTVAKVSEVLKLR